MTASFRPEEALLLAHILANSALKSRGLSVAHGEIFGVTVLRYGVPIGVWGYDRTSYVLRRLSSWEPIAMARTVDDALTRTLGFRNLD